MVRKHILKPRRQRSTASTLFVLSFPDRITSLDLNESIVNVSTNTVSVAEPSNSPSPRDLKYLTLVDDILAKSGSEVQSNLGYFSLKCACTGFCVLNGAIKLFMNEKNDLFTLQKGKSLEWSSSAPIQVLTALSRLQTKYRPSICLGYKFEKAEMAIYIYVTKFALTRDHPSFGMKPVPRSKANALKTVIAYFYSMNCPPSPVNFSAQSELSLPNVDQVYTMISDFQGELVPAGSLLPDPESLLLLLRPYQLEGIHWMKNLEISCCDDLVRHPLWKKLDCQLYYNDRMGFITDQEPTYVGGINGGILGDEMGLGKTVEMLGLILLHKCQTFYTLPCDARPVQAFSTHLSQTASSMSESSTIPYGTADDIANFESLHEDLSVIYQATTPVMSHNDDSSVRDQAMIPVVSHHGPSSMTDKVSTPALSHHEHSSMANNVSTQSVSLHEHSSMANNVSTPAVSLHEHSSVANNVSTPAVYHHEHSSMTDKVSTPAVSLHGHSSVRDLATIQPTSHHEESSITHQAATPNEDNGMDVQLRCIKSTRQPNIECCDVDSVPLDDFHLRTNVPNFQYGSGNTVANIVDKTISGILNDPINEFRNIDRSECVDFNSIKAIYPNIEDATSYTESSVDTSYISVPSNSKHSVLSDAACIQHGGVFGTDFVDAIKPLLFQSKPDYSDDLKFTYKDDHSSNNRLSKRNLDFYCSEESPSLKRKLSCGYVADSEDGVDRQVAQVDFVRDGISDVECVSSDKYSAVDRVKHDGCETEISMLPSFKKIFTEGPGATVEQLAVREADSTTGIKPNGSCRKSELVNRKRKRITAPRSRTRTKKVDETKCSSFESKRLEYERELSSYSLAYKVDPEFKPKAVIKNSGCICGQEGGSLVCSECRQMQHPACVNWWHGLKTPYLCPTCKVASGRELISSRATLIISPLSISRQWEEEIVRHAPGLSYFIYQGSTHHGFIQPDVLADNDVILTTYEVLRHELNYTGKPKWNDGRLRFGKKYPVAPSPLTAIHYWRLCSDEAQMIECPAALVSQMCSQLLSRYRWCISGTPFHKSLDDLHGLLSFLQMEPFSVKYWFDELLLQPFKMGNKVPLLELCSKILCRRRKSEVQDQLDIPKQLEEIHWLKLSPLEEHFYRRTKEACMRDNAGLLSLADGSQLADLNRKSQLMLLRPLTRLRQACVHPQVVRGEFVAIKNTTLSMEQVLASLQDKCKVEAEEGLRGVVAALNGLAALYWLQNDVHLAIETYRRALLSTDHYSSANKVRTDPLQALHTLHNLAVALASTKGTPPTLRDGSLVNEATAMRTKFLSKSVELVDSTSASLSDVNTSVKQITFDPDWWMDVLVVIDSQNKAHEFCAKLTDEVLKMKFRGTSAVGTWLAGQLSALNEARHLLCVAMASLARSPTDVDVASARDCHLVAKGSMEKCEYCCVEDLMLDYSSKLFREASHGKNFAIADNETTETSHARSKASHGVWADGPLIKAIRLLSVQAKGPLSKAGKEHNRYLGLLKKEYKLLHLSWMALRDRVAAFDEATMATARYRWRIDDDDKELLAVSKADMTGLGEKFAFDEKSAQSQLNRKLGQLKFLKTLSIEEGSTNPEPCPVCTKELGQSWVVFQCGHCFCYDCCDCLSGHSRIHIRCPVCREVTDLADVSYVSTNNVDSTKTDVAGSWSTKVTAIVQLLRDIIRRDNSVKCLIFSSWRDVLKIINHALTANGIVSTLAKPGVSFADIVTRWRAGSDSRVLLLPFSCGANGLNILEATHVILVEPLLNTGDERQAIGRVHRIGQLKETVVHRFYVSDTVEEKLAALATTLPDSSEKLGKSTLNLSVLAELVAS